VASELRIKSVSLVGAPMPHSWQFPRGVTVIVGDSGGGKTSLLNLIKYGLGGKAPITDTLEKGLRAFFLRSGPVTVIYRCVVVSTRASQSSALVKATYLSESFRPTT